ncbi:MAG: cytochrome c maturation protein CcmE [Candidatus Firestonebacteria bacterium]|nr:cytochrome c maturation protein CcmE [Candidatus Firestonebacteria bacterium]
MTSKTKKILIGSIIIIAAASYMVYSGMKDSMVYYLSVKEFLDAEEKYKDEGVRISGKVKDGSIIRDDKGMKLEFDIIDEKDPSKIIKVQYSGLIPDTFKEGRIVVVEGKFTQERIFKSTILLAKCPSKYEEKKEK